MIKILSFILFSLSTTVLMADEKKNEIKLTAAEGEKLIIAHVEGMVCDFCARGLEKTLGKKKEVKKIQISLERGTITLLMDKEKNLTDEAIIKLIKANGFTPQKIQRP